MKDLKTFIAEMAHAHVEKRTRSVMTPWGTYTGDEEEYEEYIVDKCNQQDWADFLRGKDKLGDNLKNMKLYKIDKATEFHYDFGDSKQKWQSSRFTTLAIRWKEDDDDTINWNIEMYAEDGSDLKLAEELFNDIEAYRTDKIDKDEFIGKWRINYNDHIKRGYHSSEIDAMKKSTKEHISIHMNAIL